MIGSATVTPIEVIGNLEVVYLGGRPSYVG